MPQYTFLNEETGQTIDVIMSMDENHIYIDNDGKEWSRVFYVPQTSVKDKLPTSEQEFAEYSKKRKGNIGDLTDLSRDLSEKREKESIDGTDPVAKEYLKDWKKSRRKGAKHSIEQSKSFDIVAE